MSKKLVKEAYPDLFVEFRDESEQDGIEFEFELERELKDDEWHRMPEELTIFVAEDGVFKGEYT